MSRIRAQITSVKTKKVIREFFYDQGQDDLDSVLAKVRMYILEEGMNRAESVSVKVVEI